MAILLFWVQREYKIMNAVTSPPLVYPSMKQVGSSCWKDIQGAAIYSIKIICIWNLTVGRRGDRYTSLCSPHLSLHLKIKVQCCIISNQQFTSKLHSARMSEQSLTFRSDQFQNIRGSNYSRWNIFIVRIWLCLGSKSNI